MPSLGSIFIDDDEPEVVLDPRPSPFTGECLNRADHDPLGVIVLLPFDDADLAANRLGQLTQKQKDFLAESASKHKSTNKMLGVVIAIFFGGIFFFLFPQGGSETFDCPTQIRADIFKPFSAENHHDYGQYNQ